MAHNPGKRPFPETDARLSELDQDQHKRIKPNQQILNEESELKQPASTIPQNVTKEEADLSEGELLGCLEDIDNKDQIQMSNDTILSGALALHEVKNVYVQQKPKQLATINTETSFNHTPTPPAAQNTNSVKTNKPPSNSQSGTITVCQNRANQFLKVSLKSQDGNDIEILSSRVIFPVFQKKTNFGLLTSVGKDVMFTDLNPTKEPTKFWITEKTAIIDKLNDQNLIGVAGAKHKSKEEDKQTQHNAIQRLQFDQTQNEKVLHLYELANIGDTSFNVFELAFPQNIYVYSNDTDISLLPKDKWTLGTLSFSKQDNGTTLKDHKGNSLTILSNPEYFKSFGRFTLRQTFASNKFDVVRFGSTQFFIRANFKAYVFDERVKFTMRLFITPIQPNFVPPTDNKELISIIYENRSFKVSLHSLNASKQILPYKDTQITIFDYFTIHRRVQVAIRADEALLVHTKLNKEGVFESIYFPICLCYKVLPLDKGLKDQSARFGLIHDFLKRKYNQQIFAIQKSTFTLVNEDAFNFKPDTIQQAQIKANLIIHKQFASHEEEIKQKLEIIGNICYYVDEVSFMQVVQKMEKNSPAFVILKSKNKQSYELMKAITHARHIPTQFIQYDSLDKQDFTGAFSVRKHIKNQLKAKVIPSKLIVFEKKSLPSVTVISVDVYHQMNFSIVGFMIINQQQKKLEQKFISIEVDNNQEEIIQEQLQLLIQTLKSNNYVGGDLYVIRDAYNLIAFKKREFKLWETLFSSLYDNMYLYFATKRHDLRNYTKKLNKKTNQGQVIHMSCVASYWSENEFLFTTKENAVNLLYTFFNVKGKVLTKVQQVSMIGQLSRTHYQFNEFKQSVLQWLVDQNVYSLSFLNQYKNSEDIDFEIKTYLNSVKKGAHVYDYSLT